MKKLILILTVFALFDANTTFCQNKNNIICYKFPEKVVELINEEITNNKQKYDTNYVIICIQLKQNLDTTICELFTMEKSQRLNSRNPKIYIDRTNRFLELKENYYLPIIFSFDLNFGPNRMSVNSRSFRVKFNLSESYIEGG
ncbi:MAG: hypothetical protein FGM41_02925 [Bacteroidetes bacterium]|nr:hypothetical protein [Bacteroidota bacterium]